MVNDWNLKPGPKADFYHNKSDCLLSSSQAQSPSAAATHASILQSFSKNPEEIIHAEPNTSPWYAACA